MHACKQMPYQMCFIFQSLRSKCALSQFSTVGVPGREMGVGSWAVFGSSGSCVLGFSPNTILAFVLWGA